MPSLKSRLIALVLRHTRKSAFASAENLTRWIAAARKAENHRPPAKLGNRVEIRVRDVGGFPVYEVRPPELRTEMQILYLHGGAFVFQLTSYHWMLIAELSERLGARVTVPVYPLAPEHDFHAIFGMALEVYRGLLERLPAERIAFVGDSAGANMAVVLTMMAAEAGLPSPLRHVLISPGLDMTIEGDEMPRLARLDPWLDIPGGLEAIRLYSAGINVSDWRISPVHGDLSVLPKTLILTGDRDLLSLGSVRFTERARQAGVEVELVHEKGMFHVWPLFNMPEGRTARSRIVAFLKQAAEDMAAPGAARAEEAV